MEFLPCVFFHLRRKGFLRKYLYFCVWLLFWIDNIDGNFIWDVIVVSKLGWFSRWLFVWIKMEEKGLLWLRWSYPKTSFGWSENRKSGKQGRKWCFPLFGSGEKTQRMENIGEKKSTRAHKYLFSWFGRKSGKKREKSGVSTWITYLPPWCVIC